MAFKNKLEEIPSDYPSALSGKISKKKSINQTDLIN